MKKEEKIKRVNNLCELFNDVKSFIFVNYKGLTVAQIISLRKKLKEINYTFTVVKNRLLRLVFKKLKLEPTEEIFREELGIIFSKKNNSNEIGLSKLLDKFIKENSNLKIKSVMIEGKNLAPLDFIKLSILPEKSILFAQLLGSMKAPINNFYFIFVGLLLKLICTLKAIEKKQSGL